MEKPDNLIPQEDMIDILADMAILNAAKTTNIKVFKDNNIEPTAFLFGKYGIDSLQFVESDRYYASLPDVYLELYTAVESKLETQMKAMEEAKKIRDSISNEVMNSKNRSAKPAKKKSIEDL